MKNHGTVRCDAGESVTHSVYGMFPQKGHSTMLGLLVVGRYPGEFETRFVSEPNGPGWLRRVLGALFRLKK